MQNEDVTVLLNRLSEGDETAPDRLLPLVYEDLRRLARAYFAGEKPEHTLQSNALVHEVETVLCEALRPREENLPAKYFLTVLTKNALGEILTANKKFDEAEALLLESEQDLKTTQATENQRILIAENRLTDLNKVWNKPHQTGN